MPHVMDVVMGPGPEPTGPEPERSADPLPSVATVTWSRSEGVRTLEETSELVWEGRPPSVSAYEQMHACCLRPHAVASQDQLISQLAALEPLGQNAAI